MSSLKWDRTSSKNKSSSLKNNEFSIEKDKGMFFGERKLFLNIRKKIKANPNYILNENEDDFSKDMKLTTSILTYRRLIRKQIKRRNRLGL